MVDFVGASVDVLGAVLDAGSNGTMTLYLSCASADASIAQIVHTPILVNGTQRTVNYLILSRTLVVISQVEIGVKLLVGHCFSWSFQMRTPRLVNAPQATTCRFLY